MKNQNRQGIDDAAIETFTTLNRIQHKLDLPNFILIQNKGKSPPGCSRSSESSLRLHPDINRTAGKSNRTNNKEKIKYNKSEANFKF